MSIQLNALSIVVKDMPSALRFYRMLGLDIPEVDPTEDHVDYAFPSGLRIMWDTLELIKQIDPTWKEPVGYRMGIAFECGSPSEVDAVHQRLVDAGYQSKMAPFDAFWGQRYACIYDPDGNGVDLYAALS